MIVGHGLIAKAFIHSVFDSPHYVVFASGISNSSESNPSAYTRELDLLAQYLAKNSTLIYFSTTSIFDPTKKDTLYIRHKINIENLISDQADSYLIVRLPILVGRTDNAFTLINFLVQAIKEKRPIQLHSNACRHLLDIDDVVPAMTPLYRDTKTQHTINILGSEKISIPDLVRKIEFVLQKKGEFSWQNEGACYDLPANAGEVLYINKENYVDEILLKYFGKDAT